MTLPRTQIDLCRDVLDASTNLLLAMVEFERRMNLMAAATSMLLVSLKDAHSPSTDPPGGTSDVF